MLTADLPLTENIIPPSRDDHRLILSLIPEHAAVLDMGCGNGELLSQLIQQKGVAGHGIELDPENIVQCLSRGLSVIHGDADEGLRDYPDHAYDYVIVNLALQMFRRPDRVLQEILRVGRHAIVGFPNFGYWKIRWHLLSQGRMPCMQPYRWYETPNIHVFSIRDFVDLCKLLQIRQSHAYFKTGRQWRPMHFKPENNTPYTRMRLLGMNLFATEAIFILETN